MPNAIYHDVVLHHVPGPWTQHHHGHFVQSACTGQLPTTGQEHVVETLKLIAPRWAVPIIKINLKEKERKKKITRVCLYN